MNRVTVIGAGVWGSALTRLLYCNHNQVNVWSRRSPQTLESAVSNADIIISAVSTKGIKPTIEQLKLITLSPQTIFVTATKGLDPITTLTPSQIWQQEFPHHAIVVLSGPNLSKEIDAGLPAATVVASDNLTAAEKVQYAFASDNFRVYVNNDPLGTELGGTLKNVIAIAAGVCDGLQLGANAKSALLTRALPEIIRIGVYLGAKTETFFGLSGLGDLIATCNGSLSRNYQVGYKLAEGKSLQQAFSELEGTAEGVNTTEVLIKIARNQQISVPITSQVYQLLQGKITPQQAVSALMERDLKLEFVDLD